jgi:hypothetical protein
MELTNRPQFLRGKFAFRDPADRAVLKAVVFLLLTGVPALLFYTYLQFSETGRFPKVERNPGGFFFSAMTGVITGLVLYRFNKLLDRLIPWMTYFTTRFLTGFVANALVAIGLIVSLSAIVIRVWDRKMYWSGTAPDDPDVSWKVIILTVAFVFIYNVIYALLYAYQHYAVVQLQSVKRERKQLELQFEALKSQISPHYLFNSLNTISSLLMKDLQSAEQFIRRLAQTYQYVLATQDKKYVLLKDELDFVQSYYYLLRIRFQQQLTVEINVPARIMNTRIPPLTLQMLLENAVKHNTFAEDKKLFIYIMAQDNTYLKVINTKTEMLDDVPSFKVGLENIRQRYHYLTDKEIMVQDDDKFTVSLPVLEEDNKEQRKHSA